MSKKLALGKIFTFLFLSISMFFYLNSLSNSETNNCKLPEEYEIAAENNNFQIIKYSINVAGGKLREYNGLVAVTKPGNSSSWFKILTMIRKPVSDTPGCNLN